MMGMQTWSLIRSQLAISVISSRLFSVLSCPPMFFIIFSFKINLSCSNKLYNIFPKISHLRPHLIKKQKTKTKLTSALRYETFVLSSAKGFSSSFYLIIMLHLLTETFCFHLQLNSYTNWGSLVQVRSLNTGNKLLIVN